MSNIISIMRKSDSKLLEAEANDLEKWGKLKHTKKDFELFLGFNIAEIRFKAADGDYRQIVCTSNIPLINVLQALKPKDKRKALRESSGTIRTHSKDSINTWDIRAQKTKTVSLEDWQIINFVSITPSNILLLDEIVRKALSNETA